MWRSPLDGCPGFIMSSLNAPRRRAQIDRFQCERDRNHDRADDRERPEHVDIGEQIHLMLQRLATAYDAASDALDPCPGKNGSWHRRFADSRYRTELCARSGGSDGVAGVAPKRFVQAPPPIDPPRLRATLMSADASSPGTNGCTGKRCSPRAVSLAPRDLRPTRCHAPESGVIKPRGHLGRVNK